MAFGAPQLSNHIYIKVKEVDAASLLRAFAIALGWDEKEYVYLRRIALSHAIRQQARLLSEIDSVSAFLLRLTLSQWVGKQELQQLADALTVNIRVFVKDQIFDIIGKRDDLTPAVQLYYDPENQECGTFLPAPLPDSLPPALRGKADADSALVLYRARVRDSKSGRMVLAGLAQRADLLYRLNAVN